MQGVGLNKVQLSDARYQRRVHESRREAPASGRRRAGCERRREKPAPGYWGRMQICAEIPRFRGHGTVGGVGPGEFELFWQFMQTTISSYPFGLYFSPCVCVCVGICAPDSTPTQCVNSVDLQSPVTSKISDVQSVCVCVCVVQKGSSLILSSSGRPPVPRRSAITDPTLVPSLERFMDIPQVSPQIGPWIRILTHPLTHPSVHSWVQPWNHPS